MNRHGYIGRKIRQPKLQERPAIIIVTFGSSSRSKATLALIDEKIREKYHNHDIFWAYSSNILRKLNKINSLQETLAKVESLGYRRAVVQPLHIFPGTEYQQIAETCEYFPGLQVFPGETLMHRWDFIAETVAVIDSELLGEKEGLNLLALHGTPLAADPANTTYMGFDMMVRDMYPNVLTASLEGIPHYPGVLKRIERHELNKKYEKINIIPMMFLAGVHVENDLMGEKNSWRSDLEDLGFSVQCPTMQYGEERFFKGLALYPEIIEFFMQRLARTFELARYY